MTASLSDATLDEAVKHVYQTTVHDLYWMSRRWVTESSPHPADALVHEAATRLCRDEGILPGREPDDETSATSDRSFMFGSEAITTSYALPVELGDAVMMLHRYARRYATGRGRRAVGIINSTTDALLSAGFGFTETIELDGTEYAVPGQEDLDGTGHDLPDRR